MIRSVTWLVCEDCGEQTDSHEKKGITIRRMMEVEGWSSWQNVDRCPSCTVKRREKTKSRYAVKEGGQ